MAGTIRIRAKVSDGVAEIKTLMQHDMETGTRKDEKTGQVVPAHYITELSCEHNGKVVMTANWGPAISKNPYFAFKFRNAKAGDTVKVSWMDNTGESDSVEETLK